MIVVLSAGSIDEPEIVEGASGENPSSVKLNAELAKIKEMLDSWENEFAD